MLGEERHARVQRKFSARKRAPSVADALSRVRTTTCVARQHSTAMACTARDASGSTDEFLVACSSGEQDGDERLILALE